MWKRYAYGFKEPFHGVAGSFWTRSKVKIEYVTSLYNGCVVIIAIRGIEVGFAHFARRWVGHVNQEGWPAWLCTSMTDEAAVNKYVIPDLNRAFRFLNDDPDTRVWIIIDPNLGTQSLGYRKIYENFVQKGIPAVNIRTLFIGADRLSDGGPYPGMMGRAMVELTPYKDHSVMITMYARGTDPWFKQVFDSWGKPMGSPLIDRHWIPAIDGP
ncbi:MAG: hypothetical protein Q9190_008012, partial [Brigantiaea leucoxantha]